MLRIFSFILIIILSLGYYLYTSQLIVSIAFLAYCILGLLFLKVILRTINKEVFDLYLFSFFMYSSLVLLTHIELIQNPFEDYFIHNDASLSFYFGIMAYAIPEEWNNLLDSSFFNPAFADYPLASLLFATIGKIGQEFDIVNIRLFLRMQIPTFGAMIIAVISDIFFKFSLKKDLLYKLVLPFSICSFIFISSAIFSRDIHVTFIYTLFGYYLLQPNKNNLILLVILAIIATGLRPVNGIILILPILLYINKDKGKKLSPIIFTFLIVAIILLVGDGMFDYGIRKLNYYQETTSAANVGGIFELVNRLPFPINNICICIYMLLMPLPIYMYLAPSIEGTSFLTLPFVLSPYLMALVFVSCIYFVSKKHSNHYIKKYILCTLLLFFLIIYAAPDIRRAFAVIPMLYMAFCIIYKDIPKSLIRKTKNIIWPIIVVINLIFIIYLL